MSDSNDKRIYLGSDHAGFQSKQALKDFLTEEGYEVNDLGCFSEESCDYPDFAREVAEKVVEAKGSRGILICGTGTGMAISANKMKGVRAAMANSEYLAEMSRRHNDANVLTMGARVTEIDEMKKITNVFLNTGFEGDVEKYVRRVDKISAI